MHCRSLNVISTQLNLSEIYMFYYFNETVILVDTEHEIYWWRN